MVDKKEEKQEKGNQEHLSLFKPTKLGHTVGRGVGVGSQIFTNSIYFGDNLEVMQKFPKECVSLIYLDPPFFSNKNYEIIWHDGFEERAYEDRWKGGIREYIEWMRPRLEQMHDILKPTGSIYLHCDWHANHRLRVSMDEIFGEQNFQNEIIWHYRGRGMQKSRFQRKHDVILFYSKGDKWNFNETSILVPYDPAHIGRYNKIDEDGRRYALIKKRGSGHTRVYLKEGVVPDDVWDIPFIHGEEALGYPTQKPEALLEQIIKASSNEGDVVLDPFCGCGTALVVAEKLGRQWIGIDVSPKACEVMQDRMGKTGIRVRILPTPGKSKLHIDTAKKLSPGEFQSWVIFMIGGSLSKKLTADMGIDGYVSAEHYPVQIKQSDNVGRNVVDNFETAIRRAGKKKGYIIAFSFGKGAYEETARTRQENRLDIQLIRFEEINDYF